MASERPTKILLTKSDLTREQIDALTDAQAWRLIYGDGPHRRRPKDDRPQICFSGFGHTRTQELSAIADTYGLKTVTSVTKGLVYLCGGAEVGPSKLAKAREQGVCYLIEEQFLRLVETGEIPESKPDIEGNV
jgi:NAD-dependent DNA ligase